jgi:hypothetical protein
MGKTRHLEAALVHTDVRKVVKYIDGRKYLILGASTRIGRSGFRHCGLSLSPLAEDVVRKNRYGNNKAAKPDAFFLDEAPKSSPPSSPRSISSASPMAIPPLY